MGKEKKYAEAIYNWREEESPREKWGETVCELVGIKVLDHVIIGDNNYFSFFNEGLIKEEPNVKNHFY